MGRQISNHATQPFDSYYASEEILGVDRAMKLFIVGGSCLIIVLIFGIILCRLDISAGKKRRSQSLHYVES